MSLIILFSVSDEQVDNQFRWPDNTPLSYVHQNESWVERVPDRLDCGYVPTTGTTVGFICLWESIMMFFYT